jgi:hypothetical protein
VDEILLRMSSIPLVAAIERLHTDALRLDQTLPGEVGGRRRKYARLQLWEAAANAISMADLVTGWLSRSDWMPSATPLEALLRTTQERALVLAWLSHQPVAQLADADVAVDQLLKVNARKFIDSGFEADRATVQDSELDIKEPPPLTQMGEGHQPNILALWRKVSHLSHPLAVLPGVTDSNSRIRLEGRLDHVLVWHSETVDALIASAERIDRIAPPSGA